jgi:two-component system C4-dicarboxylate transport sensor histidine kinase DctB
MMMSQDNPNLKFPKLATPTAPQLPESDEAPARLAHELANLLDGSLRNVGLAISTLKADAEHHKDADVQNRLEVASNAMQQMAMLIRRWMTRSHTPDRLHAQTQTFAQTVEHAIRLLTPAARMRNIDIFTQIDDGIATLPAGPIYPIIANAVRNSIEAINSDMNNRPGRARGSITVSGEMVQGQVVLRITDNGPGFDPTLLDANGQIRFGVTTKDSGYGLGLSLSREIVQRLEGNMYVGMPDEPSDYRGAEMIVRFPVSKLQEFDR